MSKYREKVVVIEAEQFTGKGFLQELDFPETFAYAGDFSSLTIENPEGITIAKPGDYVVKRDDGGYCVWIGDLFPKTHEPLEATP